MLELHNTTDWQAELAPGWSRERAEQFTLVVKLVYRFDLCGELRPAAEQAPLVRADSFRGTPATSSLVAAGELVPFKAGGEVLLSGVAYPRQPGARAMETVLGLELRNGQTWRKTLRVAGRCYWRKRWGIATPSAPQVVEPLPLVYEHAYGGVDSRRRDLERRNPAGKGFAVKIADGLALAQIEQGPKFVSRGGDRPPPAGYGPIAAHWMPRYETRNAVDDEAMAAGLCPYPQNVAPTLYNTAPADQQFAEPFQGGELVTLAGFFPPSERTTPLQLRVPGPVLRGSLLVNGRAQRLEPVADTLLIDTQARTLAVLLRAGIPWRRTQRQSGRVLVEEMESMREASA